MELWPSLGQVKFLQAAALSSPTPYGSRPNRVGWVPKVLKRHQNHSEHTWEDFYTRNMNLRTWSTMGQTILQLLHFSRFSSKQWQNTPEKQPLFPHIGHSEKETPRIDLIFFKKKSLPLNLLICAFLRQTGRGDPKSFAPVTRQKLAFLIWNCPYGQVHG